MLGDIRNKIKVLQYPKVDKFEQLSKEEIINYIQENACFEKKYDDNLNYYIGKNTTINKKADVDPYNPDSRLNVPYSRTFTQIVKGYMYKPGLITYHSENEQYLETLKNIFKKNNEPLVTSENGESQAKYGLGVELLYVDIDEEGLAIPKFVNVNPAECIFFFSMDLSRSLIGAIRYYIIEKNETKNEIIYRVEVYYKDRIETYKMIERNSKITLETAEVFDNLFQDIPFSLYINNQEYNADYEPVRTLIDAYDILNSDGVNEIQRFASAYLILRDFILVNGNDDNAKRVELEKMKTRRVMEFIGKEGGAEFLTRDIPSGFFELLKQTLREDIEYHSHIPDFRSTAFQAASGIAMQWGLFDFENLCGDKQALFEVGLQRRITLINKILKIKAVDSDDVWIKFDRNKPVNATEKITNFVQLAQTNKLADEDLLRVLPEEIIPDLEAVIERAKKQKEENIAMFDIDSEEDSVDEEESEDG